ncbi:DUF4037 domain-containing protein [Bifidobacterium canis]|uniref:Tetratricopeptide repeat n=1 Tax=Bifidobacterium canis TaxID=2610880 RepID=A0A7K1J5V1_9BIFI|nr:DUF4037 domain-containing protein [Bifidobacterium canis]MUH59972.1 Tetratricopeptide repeat [Bifidobacterium canis]
MNEDAQDSPHATFDVNAFLAGLDDLFANHTAKDKADDYLKQAMADAENAEDWGGLLTVLNETMGFYRSQGRHDDNQWIIQRALELALRMGLEGTEAWTTTLINAATSQRAAGNFDQAQELFDQALDSARATYAPNDRRLAALHNNRSMLFSETNRKDQAIAELRASLDILEHSSVDAQSDVDIASTCTNLALAMLDSPESTDSEGELREARALAQRSLDIYEHAHAQGSAHYASALAGYAHVCFAAHDYAAAVSGYRDALAVIERCYGKNTDYYRVTAENLAEAERKLAASAHDNPQIHTSHSEQSDSEHPQRTVHNDSSQSTADGAQTVHENGLQLSRAYWQEVVKPMLAEKYADAMPRIAAGLAGHGSECYGFDDAISRDHDFGPRVCLWLTDDDYQAFGEQLQKDYDALPQVFHNVSRSATTPRAQGAAKRDGVFAIGAFFEQLTGMPHAPAEDEPHLWLSLDEATLASATNGRVFADALGKFSAARQSFLRMPDDVLLSLISRRLGMISQAGQYNLPRMLQRGDGAAAWLSISEFAQATSSLVFLLNNPASVGYAPYYKWRFAALRRLSARPAVLLPQVCGELEHILQLASAACFGGAGFGEGGRGAAPNVDAVTRDVDDICAQIVAVLQQLGLTDSDERFLEWQRPYVESHITSTAACLHSI